MSLTASSDVKLLHMWCQYHNHRFSLQRGAGGSGLKKFGVKLQEKRLWAPSCQSTFIYSAPNRIHLHFQSTFPQSNEKPKQIPPEQWEETLSRARLWRAAICFDRHCSLPTTRGSIQCVLTSAKILSAFKASE